MISWRGPRLASALMRNPQAAQAYSGKDPGRVDSLLPGFWAVERNRESQLRSVKCRV